MKLEIKVSSLMIVCVYFLSMITIQYISSYNTIKYALLAVVGLYVIRNISIVANRRYFKINIVLLLFCLVTIINSYLDRNLISNRDPFLASIVFAGALFESFMVFEIAAELGEEKSVINIFTVLSFGILILTDILALTTGSTVGLYLIGDKFHVVYLHFYCLTFLWIQEKADTGSYTKKLLIGILAAWTLFMSFSVDCMTGVLGLIVLTICFFAESFFTNKLNRSVVYVIVVILSASFISTYEFIISNARIATFITNTLNRSLTLTGRVDIYERFVEAMQGRWLFGFGYGSSYEICKHYFGYADSQNAIMEWFLQIGVFGTLLLVFLMVCLLEFNRRQNTKTSGKAFPIISLLYAFTVLGSIEITYNLTMIVTIALLLVFDCGVYEDEKQLCDSQEFQ